MSGMDDLSEQLAQKIYGRSRQECSEQGICVKCGEEAKAFRDEISKKEFELTVWCQKCQDDFFGVD